MLLYTMVAFLKYISDVRRYSEHTIRNYSIDLDAFLVFIKEKHKMPEKHESLYRIFKSYRTVENIHIANDLSKYVVNKNSIRAFLAHLHYEGKCRRTILRRFASMKSFCRFCVSEGIMNSSSCDGLASLKKPAMSSSILDRELIYSFFEQPKLSTIKGFRDRCIMELLYCTGMRVSELTKMNLDDVNMKDGTVKIRGKDKQERMCFLNQCVVNWIEAYIKHPKRVSKVSKGSDPVFLNCFGERISVRSVDRNFKDYVLKSGFSCKITPHSLRRALACHFLEKGIDIKKIKKILGHRSLSSTTIYAKSTMDTKLEAYKKGHPRA